MKLGVSNVHDSDLEGSEFSLKLRLQLVGLTSSLGSQAYSIRCVTQGTGRVERSFRHEDDS